MSFDADADVQQGLSAASNAADQDKITAIQNGDKIGATVGDHMPVKDWMANLPKNITVGVMDAARNTVDAANSFNAYLENNQKLGDRRGREQGVDPGGPPQPSAQELRLASLERDSPPPAIAQTLTPASAGHLSPEQIYGRNSKYAGAAPAGGYGTTLSPDQEAGFQAWVKANKVPFDSSPTSDYDMRGFYKGLQSGDPNAVTGVNQNDGKLHFSDYYKTPYHHSFSGESQFANPATAPKWNNQDQLVTPDGKVVFDERSQNENPYMEHASFRNKFQAFRDELASGSTTSDTVTQGIAQFAVPMLGWTKLLGAQKAISLAGFGAEALTASTALEPHAGRNADLVAYGKTVEGKLGDALNAISPDGSAFNAYINYMTDRTNEGEAEGRFKNVIDSVVTTASGAGLLKTGAAALKVGMNLPSYIAQNAGSSRVGAAAQEGKIVFHGTASNFDEFDSSKIGSGEGNQSYGHGLYFAENPATAGTYQQRLMNSSHPDIASAAQDVDKAGGSKPKAVVALNAAADSSTNPAEAMFLRRKAQLIKSGAVDRARGKLMHVDIADSNIDKMLDWDKKLSEQPPEVRKALAAYSDGTGDPTGGVIYKSLQMGSSAQDATAHLAGLGIPGIKYLDSGSRNSGEGTRNIVLFDAKHAKIVKKE